MTQPSTNAPTPSPQPNGKPSRAIVDSTTQQAEKRNARLAKQLQKAEARRERTLVKRQQKLASQPAKPGVGGRPRHAEQDLQLHGVTVRLDEAEYQLLCSYAAAGGRTQAAVLRALLRKQALLTSEQHQQLRGLPTLVVRCEELMRQLNTRPEDTAVAQLGELTWRLEALLTTFEAQF